MGGRCGACLLHTFSAGSCGGRLLFGVASENRQQKSPAEGRALSLERFWESFLVSTPEVVFRTPHTKKPYGVCLVVP